MGKITTIETTPTLDLQSVQLFYTNRNKHFYALPTQRNFVWELKRQSELIQSLITNYPIGDLCVHFNDGNDEYMDGQQRSRTIDRYIGDKFRLHESIDNVEAILNMNPADKKEFVIAGKSFSELDEPIKQILLTRMIRIERFYNLTDEQINEVILRKNNGKQLTTIEKTRMIAGEVQSFVSELSSHDFFVRKINLIQSSKDDFNHEAIIYTILLYETGLKDDYATKSQETYAIHIRDNNLLTDEIQTQILKVIDYMNLVFPTKHKILTQASTPSIYQVCKRAMNDKIDPRVFYKFVDEFYNQHKAALTGKTGYITRVLIDQKTKFILDYYDQVSATLKN